MPRKKPKEDEKVEVEYAPRRRGLGFRWCFGVLLLVVGLLWLLARYGIVRMEFGVLCPVLLIILGILLIFKSVGRGGCC